MGRRIAVKRSVWRRDVLPVSVTIDNTRAASTIPLLLRRDSRPILHYFLLSLLFPFLHRTLAPTAPKQIIDKPPGHKCTDCPEPSRDGEPKRHKQTTTQHNGAETDPEESGDKGQTEDAQDERDEEKQGDEGEEELRDNKGL